MMETLGIILGSTVLAALISGIVALATSRKQESLQYITAERKEWREKIKDIASRLQGATSDDTKKILTELKVRINAYGSNDKAVKYSQDVHIWRLIREMEIERDPNILELQQSQMVEYLAILLKDDWERSKKEVKGDIYHVLGVVLFMASGIYFPLSIFFAKDAHVNVFELGMVAICHFFLIGAINYLFGEANQTYDQILVGAITIAPEQYKLRKVSLCYLIWAVLLIILSIVYGASIRMLLHCFSCGDNGILIWLISEIIFLVAAFLVSWTKVNALYDKFTSNETINQIRTKYGKAKMIKRSVI